jgi:hypothetical protein
MRSKPTVNCGTGHSPKAPTDSLDLSKYLSKILVSTVRGGTPSNSPFLLSSLSRPPSQHSEVLPVRPRGAHGAPASWVSALIATNRSVQVNRQRSTCERLAQSHLNRGHKLET